MMTDRELLGQFENINAKLDLITEHQQKDIDRNASDIKDISERLTLNGTTTQKVETKIDNHLDGHQTRETRKIANLELWVLVGLFAIDKIGAWIRLYIPAP